MFKCILLLLVFFSIFSFQLLEAVPVTHKKPIDEVKNAHKILKRQSSGSPSISVPAIPLPFFEDFPWTPPAIAVYFEQRCQVCSTIAQNFADASQTLPSYMEFRKAFMGICDASLSLSGYDPSSMCPGFFELYVPPIFQIFKNTTLSIFEICQRLNYCVNYTSTSLHSSININIGSKNSSSSSSNSRRRDTTINTLADQTNVFQQMFQRAFPPGASRDHSQRNSHGSRSGKEEVSNSATSRLFKPTKKSLKNTVNEMRAKLPHVNSKSHASRRQIANNNSNSNVIRLLHLPDIHLDPYYKPGSNSNCGTFLCCRAIYGPGNAGTLGSSVCDMPFMTLQGLFTFIQNNFVNSSSNLNIDYAFWTGDNPPHDIWNTTFVSLKLPTTIIKNMFIEHLPNIKVFPAFGTLEGFPNNLYYQPNDSAVVDFLAETWSQWLSNETLSSVKESGYYSELIIPGLRMISLNTLFGFTLNYYVLLNEQVPAVEKQWNFTRTILKQARENNEKVIIIGHIPPGGTTAIPTYGSVYSTIVSEYADVITLQMFGHTHLDQFIVVKSVGSAQSIYPTGYPAGVAFISPSVSPYIKTNPSFRIYTLNATTFEFIDHDTYYFDLALAERLVSNVTFPSPTYLATISSTLWTKLYSLKENYNITLTPSLPVPPPTLPLFDPATFNSTGVVAPNINLALNELSARMLNNTALAGTYSTLQYGTHTPRECKIETGCTKAAYCFTSCSDVTSYASCLGGYYDPHNLTGTARTPAPASSSNPTVSRTTTTSSANGPSSIIIGVSSSSGSGSSSSSSHTALPSVSSPTPTITPTNLTIKSSLKNGVFNGISAQQRRFSNLRKRAKEEEEEAGHEKRGF